MHDHITAAISAARTPAQLDAAVKGFTAAWAAGTVSDDEFSRAYGLAHRRRLELRGEAPGQRGLPLAGGHATPPPTAPSFRPTSRNARRIGSEAETGVDA